MHNGNICTSAGALEGSQPQSGAGVRRLQPCLAASPLPKAEPRLLPCPSCLSASCKSPVPALLARHGLCGLRAAEHPAAGAGESELWPWEQLPSVLPVKGSFIRLLLKTPFWDLPSGSAPLWGQRHSPNWCKTTHTQCPDLGCAVLLLSGVQAVRIDPEPAC